MRSHGLPSGLIPALALTVGALSLSHCDVFSEGIDIPISFDQAFDVRADLGAATGAAAGQQSPVDASYPVTIGAVAVDLVSQSPELERNRAKVQAIELTKITVTPTTNTLTSATPPIALYVGPKGATSIDQAVKITTLPPIPAGSTASVEAAVDTAAQDAAQPYLTSLDFTVIPTATLSVQAGETVPGGAADLHVVLGIKVTLDITK